MKRMQNVPATAAYKKHRLWHGTPSEASAKAILKSGYLQPRAVTGVRSSGRGWTEPVAGRVYVTPVRGEAIGYALSKGPVGWLFEVDAGALDDVEPDEDAVGALTGSLLLLRDARPTPELAAFSDLAERVLTKRELDRLVSGRGTGSLYAKIGKKIIPEIPPSLRTWMLSYKPAVAHAGPLPILRSWRIGPASDSEDVDEKFKRFAREIPVRKIPEKRKVRERRRKRRKNVTRDEWLDAFIDEIAESEGVEAREVDLTEEIEAQVEQYTAAVDDVVARCSRFFVPVTPIDVDEGVYYDLYRTLEGSGAGIWDGRWDRYYPAYTREQWRDLMRCYEAKLGRFVDDAGGGSLVEAIRQAVFDAKAESEEDDVVGGGLDAQLEAINRHRRQIHMAELDARRSGWTPDDIRSEYLRIQQLNPAREMLLGW